MGKRRTEFDPRKATKKELVKEYEALMDICEELQVKRRNHKTRQRAAEAKLKEYRDREYEAKRIRQALINVGP